MSGKIKRAFLSCAIVTILAFSLMLGSTMAWFQDTAIAVNTYTFGKLDVDIQRKNENGEMVQAQTLGFVRQYGVGGTYTEGEYLFEPGATFQLEEFYVANEGDIPLQYRVELDYPKDAKLMEAMDVYIRMGGENLTGTVGTLEAGKSTPSPVIISLHMREDAGNEYQNFSVSGVVVRVYAAQLGVSLDEAMS